MAEKKFKKWYLIPIFFVLLFGILYFTGVIGGGLTKNQVYGGVTPLSVSKASIVTDGQLGQSWLVSVSTLPNAFTITGRISASDVASQTSQTPLTDFDVNINARQVARFPITNSVQPIYDYVSSVSPYTCLTVDTSRFDPTAFVSYGYKNPLSVNCYTINVYRIQHGVFGIVSSQASFPTSIDISVSANGKTSNTVTLDTASTTSLPLVVGGKTLGRVDYAGDLVNSALPRPELFQQYKPLNKDGSWYFTDVNAYNSYNGLDNSNPSNSITSCLTTIPSNSGYSSTTAQSLFASCVTPYHSAYLNLQPQVIAGLSEIKVDAKSQIYTEFTLAKLYSFPVLSFLLDVDWVGFKKNVGIPNIDSVSSGSCASGSRGTVQTVVRNSGSSGAFDVSLTCPSGTSVLTSVQSLNFDAGQSRTLSFDFDMNVGSKTSSACSVKAIDKGSFATVSKAVSVSCSGALICTPNSEYCDGQVRKVCSSDGTGFVVKTGDTQCITPDGSGVVCSDKFFGLVPSSPSTTLKCGFLSSCWFGLSQPVSVAGCQNDWTLLLILLAFIVVVIIGLIVFLKYFNKPRGRK